MGFLTSVLGLKPAKPPSPQPMVDQSAAMDAANGDATNALRKRRGAAANELNGPGGAEAQTPGGRALLGVAG